MRTRTSTANEPSTVVSVTNHAVRRFAERADCVASPPDRRMTDAEAVSHLARGGYPVEEVRRMLAIHAQDGVRVGASRVRFDRILLCIQGRSVVTCLPG